MGSSQSRRSLRAFGAGALALAAAGFGAPAGALATAPDPTRLPLGDQHYSTSAASQGMEYRWRLARRRAGSAGRRRRGVVSTATGPGTRSGSSTVDGSVAYPQANVKMKLSKDKGDDHG